MIRRKCEKDKRELGINEVREWKRWRKCAREIFVICEILGENCD